MLPENTNLQLKKDRHFFFLLIRLVLGYIFLSSGLCKLTHGAFGQLIGPPLLIDELKEYGLETFGYIIASSQVIVGALVLTQRFSLLGLIALVPINLGILGVTISQGWTGTPYVNAFFLILNIAALLYEYPALQHLVSAPKDRNISSPYSTQFFPEIWTPLLFLLLVLLTIGASFINYSIVLLLANIFFVLLAGYLLWGRDYLFLQKIVLICFFVCILAMTDGQRLMDLGAPLVVFFIGGFSIGMIAWIFSLFPFGKKLGQFGSK